MPTALGKRNAKAAYWYQTKKPTPYMPILKIDKLESWYHHNGIMKQITNNKLSIFNKCNCTYNDYEDGNKTSGNINDQDSRNESNQEEPTFPWHIIFNHKVEIKWACLSRSSKYQPSSSDHSCFKIIQLNTKQQKQSLKKDILESLI